MALKNETLSPFEERLKQLMINSCYDTSKKLATILYDKDLISINNKPSLDEDFHVRSNAIGSIEKKIRNHLHAENPNVLQGEFAIAYSKFFNCSTDYLFGLTDIKVNDFSIKKICEQTGLSETVINRFTKMSHDDEPSFLIAKWNDFL